MNKLTVILLLGLIGCNTGDKNSTPVNEKDSLLKVIDSLQQTKVQNSKIQNSPIQETVFNSKKYGYILIHWIRQRHIFSTFDQSWVPINDTLTALSPIKEFENYNEDVEYRALDDAESHLLSYPKTNFAAPNDKLLKVLDRTLKTFDSYPEASRAVEKIKRQLENESDT